MPAVAEQPVEPRRSFVVDRSRRPASRATGSAAGEEVRLVDPAPVLRSRAPPGMRPLRAVVARPRAGAVRVAEAPRRRPHAEAPQHLPHPAQAASAQRRPDSSRTSGPTPTRVERRDGRPVPRAERGGARGRSAAPRPRAPPRRAPRRCAPPSRPVLAALGERVHPRVHRGEDRLVVVRRRAPCRAACRSSGPSRRRRGARTSARSCARRSSGRGSRRRPRAATPPGRRS